MNNHINAIQDKISNMNKVDLDKIHKFIQKIEQNKSEIDNDFYLNFDWLEDINQENETTQNLSDDEIKKMTINWRLLKNVHR